MERKYRQKGYQDDQKDISKDRPAKLKSEGGYGSRLSPRIETRFTDVVRCANCSAIVEQLGDVSFTDQCKKCRADLHSCKNCKYFDPGSRFECKKPIEGRIAKKNERNMCLQFSIKVSVEKQQPMQEEFGRKKEEQQPVSAGRQAFDALFKK